MTQTNQNQLTTFRFKEYIRQARLSHEALKALDDIPNYHKAEGSEMCANCTLFKAGNCVKYKAKVKAGYTCDEWQGKSVTTEKHLQGKHNQLEHGFRLNKAPSLAKARQYREEGLLQRYLSKARAAQGTSLRGGQSKESREKESFVKGTFRKKNENMTFDEYPAKVIGNFAVYGNKKDGYRIGNTVTSREVPVGKINNLNGALHIARYVYENHGNMPSGKYNEPKVTDWLDDVFTDISPKYSPYYAKYRDRARLTMTGIDNQGRLTATKEVSPTPNTSMAHGVGGLFSDPALETAKKKKKQMVSAKEASLTPPESAQSAAKRALAWRDKYGDEVKAMTPVGWIRARQLASGKPLSMDIVKRMAQFNRHRKNADVNPKYKDEPWRDNGYVAWLGWGGTSGIDWAIAQVNKANREQESAKETKLNNQGRDMTAKESKPMKKEVDGLHPATHYLVVENPNQVSTWHLQVYDKDGKLDRRLMGAAKAALTVGYRGNKYQGPDKQKALDKLAKLYKGLDVDMPISESKAVTTKPGHNHGRSVKNPLVYEALLKKGMPKRVAAAISNAQAKGSVAKKEIVTVTKAKKAVQPVTNPASTPNQPSQEKQPVPNQLPAPNAQGASNPLHIAVGNSLGQFGVVSTLDAYGAGPEPHGSAWKAPIASLPSIQAALLKAGYKQSGGKFRKNTVLIDTGKDKKTFYLYITDNEGVVKRGKELLKAITVKNPGHASQLVHGFRHGKKLTPEKESAYQKAGILDKFNAGKGSKSPLPSDKDLTKRSKAQRKRDIEVLAQKPLKELRKMQDLVSSQMRDAIAQKKTSTIDNLNLMTDDLIAAIDKKEFGK